MNPVAAAAVRIAPHIRRTPVLSSAVLDGVAGVRVHFKCENFQHTGAFKMRGAMNALLARGGERLHAGVATHSSGNHGAALARAAKLAGIPAYVVMPRDAPAFKRANVERYGGVIHECGPTLGEREARLDEVVAVTSAVVIPPYDDDDVIAGQGTAVLEFLEMVPDLAEIWVPIGGGGLAAGAVLAFAGRRGVRIVGAEPELADDAAESLRTGTRQPQRPPLTIADGLRTALGVRNFRILHGYGLEVVCVGERAIGEAQVALANHLHAVIEPSSAVPFAALLKRKRDDGDARPVGVIVTGGNVDPGAGTWP